MTPIVEEKEVKSEMSEKCEIKTETELKPKCEELPHKRYFDFKSIVVDANNFEEDNIQNLLMQCVDNCDYIAMDCEFGISLFRQYKDRSLKELYEQNLNHWNHASLFQVGLTFFKFTKDSEGKMHEFKYNSFSLIVIPDTESDVGNIWSVEVSSLAFLNEHGFDFKDYFINAIKYSPPKDDEFYKNSKCEKKNSMNLTQFFNAIFSKKKSVIVHRGFNDLLLVYACFAGKSPETYEEFKEKCLEFFNSIYDTKLLTMDIDNNFLGNVYQQLCEANSEKLKCVDLTETISQKASDVKPHDASYDSFMTAIVFALKSITASETFKIEQYADIVRGCSGSLFADFKSKEDKDSAIFWDNLDALK